MPRPNTPPITPSTRLLVVALLLMAGGCSSITVGSFQDDAFYHARMHYRVRYDGEPGVLLPDADWTLENFLEGRDGRPSVASPSPRFRTSYQLELDGRPQRPVRAELFDLRFVHRRDGTVMWARSAPMPGARSRTQLQVLARDYVDLAASGSAIEVDYNTNEVRARRYAPRVLFEGPAQVDGQAAYFVVFEHVDLDRREAQADAQGDLITLVFVRPHLPWRAGVTGGAAWPMVLLFGYASRPEHHAAHRAEFESLVGRVDLRPAPVR